MLTAHILLRDVQVQKLHFISAAGVGLCLCMQLDSKNSPLAMLARTCNSIGKDSVPSKAGHQSQQQTSDKKDSSARLIKSTSPGKKSLAGVEAPTSRKEPASTTSRQSTTLASRERSSSSPTSSRQRLSRDVGESRRQGEGSSRWSAVSDAGSRPRSSGGSPVSTSKTADSDHDSVDEPRCATSTGLHRDRDRQLARAQASSPYSSSDAPLPPSSMGLYESLRLQQEAVALQAAAAYSPLHQLLAERHLTDPLAMYSASLQAAAVVAAAAAQANLNHVTGNTGRLPGKDYRLGDVLRPCGGGVDAADVMRNGDVDSTMFGVAAGMMPLRAAVPPLAHQHQPYTCSWLTAGGEFCAQRFSTSEQLFSHLRTHVDGATASEDPRLPAAASCSAFMPPGATGLMCGQAAALPVAPAAVAGAPGSFGGSAAASLAAAQAAASLYSGKVPRYGRPSRDSASASPTSSSGGSLLLHAAAAAAAAASSRYHPYKWTPPPFVASQFAAGALAGVGAGVSNSDLTATPAPSALSAFLQQPPYTSLFTAQTLGAAVP